MNSLRLLGVVVLFVLVGLGTVGGCGSSGSGEGCCVLDDVIGSPAFCFESTKAVCDRTDPPGLFIFNEGVMCVNIPVCNAVQPVTAPILLTPINDAIIQQNNPNIGCPFNSTSGFGHRIFYDWTDASSPIGINGYHLFVKNMNAIFPIVDLFVSDSNFTDPSCNSFVADANLNDWIWSVQAEDNFGNLSSVATGEFMFGPCRLADGTPCNAIPPPVHVTAPILLTPINDAIIQQNNPNIGCPFDPTFGFGHRIFFDWTDASSPNGINGYYLFVKRMTATIPIVDLFVPDSNFTHTSCNSFVVDSFLDGWIWTVQAVDILGNLSSVATGEFMFGPCRLADGTPCTGF